MTLNEMTARFVELCSLSDFWKSQAPECVQRLRCACLGVTDDDPDLTLRLRGETGTMLVWRWEKGHWLWSVHVPGPKEDAVLEGVADTLGRDFSADDLCKIRNALRGHYCEQCGQRLPQ